MSRRSSRPVGRGVVVWLPGCEPEKPPPTQAQCRRWAVCTRVFAYLDSEQAEAVLNSLESSLEEIADERV